MATLRGARASWGRRTVVELAEAAVGVGLERAHTQVLGDGERLLVETLCALDVRIVAGGDHLLPSSRSPCPRSRAPGSVVRPRSRGERFVQHPDSPLAGDRRRRASRSRVTDTRSDGSWPRPRVRAPGAALPRRCFPRVSSHTPGTRRSKGGVHVQGRVGWRWSARYAGLLFRSHLVTLPRGRGFRRRWRSSVDGR